MENKILVFGAGVLLGYFLCKELTKNQTVPAPSVQVAPDKQKACEEKLQQQLLTIRPSSAEALEQYKKDFMDSCLKS